MSMAAIFLQPTAPAGPSSFNHSLPFPNSIAILRSVPSLSSFKPSLPFSNSRTISLQHFYKPHPCTFQSTLQKKAVCFSSAFSSQYSSDAAENTPLHPVLLSLQTHFKTPFNLKLPTSPIEVCKWAAVVSISIAVAKRTVSLLLNPFFWTFFSWTWLFWPWFFAISLAIYGAYCMHRHLHQEANVFEQLVIVISSITWLTLVPPAYFNGFLEGWPFVFFFAYHYYLFFDASIRKHLYGDLYARPHDPKWDISPPNWARLLFAAAVMAAHWLAAAEGPELQRIPGGWANVAIWIFIFAAQILKYNSLFYLSKYSEKVAVPTAVVQFGPYRWVRHPIYASAMLLLATYFAALRAPLSLLFIVGVCLAYYDWKARLEEKAMVESFGESYKAYMNRVPYKFIPLLY